MELMEILHVMSITNTRSVKSFKKDLIFVFLVYICPYWAILGALQAFLLHEKLNSKYSIFVVLIFVYRNAIAADRRMSTYKSSIAFY